MDKAASSAAVEKDGATEGEKDSALASFSP